MLQSVVHGTAITVATMLAAPLRPTTRPTTRDHRQLSLQSRLTRAVFPRVMEFKVISRELEKHEFMPVVYVIDRSMNWKKRVPAYVERELIEEYISPLLRVHGATTNKMTKENLIATLAQQLQQRTQLADLTSPVCIDERAYKLAALVDYALGSLPATSSDRSELNQVVRQILSTLRDVTNKRALIVPVALHYCAAGSFLNVRRFAGIRYGAPVLLQERDIEIFQEDPTEFVQHISARLRTSLKMSPPNTVAQMELLRLSRTLHVYCAKVVRDDCFSRRQIASMNEEILQIHFRTRNHPDMQDLKTRMAKYCHTLKRWKLRDEDINSASTQVHPPTNPLHYLWLLSSILQRLAAIPIELLFSGACDWIYRSPQRKTMAATAIFAAVLKWSVALIAFGVFCRLLMSSNLFWTLGAMVCLALGVIVMSYTATCQEMARHWKKIQFYIMETSELNEIKKTRASLARSIHALVAQYFITDLPPPVLQDQSKSAIENTDFEANDEYSLNPHHKIFINAPRSFPLAFAKKLQSRTVAKRVIYAPKMLRNETWRHIYETLAPKHLRFAALLANNKGDNLPMDELLETPFFSAVLDAYVISQEQSNDVAKVTAVREASHVDGACESDIDDEQKQLIYGGFGSIQGIIEAALQMAQDEEEL